MTSKLTGTNGPTTSSGEAGLTRSLRSHHAITLNTSPPEGPGGKQYGDYIGGDPPLPIPNRDVKPARADGTAKAGE